MQIRTLLLALLACSATSPMCWSDSIDPAQAIAQKFYEADQPRHTAPASAPAAKPKPTRPDPDYEMDMLRRARAEEAERLNGATEKAVPQQAVMAAPARVIPVATVQPAAELLPKPSPEPEPSLIEPPASPPIPTAKPLHYAIAQQDPEPSPPSNQTRATVLIVLDTGDNDARVKPDPIICFDQQCWISNGLEAPAKPVPRSVAVALKTTETATGDSCSGKSGCAFRDIAFDPVNRIQVVEVGESRGVAGDAYTIAADTSCRKHDGDLMCNNTLATHAFRMWVVPEPTAQAIGPSGLEDAVADGLRDDGEDSDDGK
jgi:hypothetical protein